MKQDKISPQLKIILLIITVTTILSILGATYAYFSANITGSETTETISVESGKLTIAYHDGKNINVQNIIPQNEAIDDKEFSVIGNNSTNTKMTYYIELHVQENSFSNNAITYTLESKNETGTGHTAPDITKQKGIRKGMGVYSLGNAEFTSGQNQTHSYVLSLYFPENLSNQNQDLGKILKAYICVNSTEAKLGHSLTTTIKEDNQVKTGADFSVLANKSNTEDQEGFFSIPDDFGTSYYFRGTHAGVNNNLIFAGYQWKIIRIDGSNNVRLIYNGRCLVEDCHINDGTAEANAILPAGLIQYNLDNTSNAHVGYMYGEIDGSTHATTHANTNSSFIKTILDSFYNSFSEANQLKMVESQYCTDRIVASINVHQNLYGSTAKRGTGIEQSRTAYATFNRLLTSKKPNLRCTSKNDKLMMKVGLITADEVAFAGAVYNKANSDYYLSINLNYWTMSPSYYNEEAGVFNVNANGAVGFTSISNQLGVRPVITLKSSVKVEGTGSTTDPYRVV